MAVISGFILLCMLHAAVPQGVGPRGPRPVTGRGDSPNATPPPFPPRPEDCKNGIIHCPVKVFFTLDTSETIALQEAPPGSLVTKVKEFTKMFAQELNDELYKGHVQISWSIGGLNFSETQFIFSQFTNKETFIRNVTGIIYEGKGTFTDCALERMAKYMTEHSTGTKSVLFSVVITDGHVTRSPCGGIKAMAEKAREKGIQIFSVAASRNIDDLGMKEIASSPAEVYRDDYIVVDIINDKPRIVTESIQRIIKAMVI